MENKTKIFIYVLIAIIVMYFITTRYIWCEEEIENFDPSLVPVSSIVTLAKVAQKLVDGNGTLTNPGNLTVTGFITNSGSSMQIKGGGGGIQFYNRSNQTKNMEIYNNATAAEGDNMLRIYSPDINADMIKIDGKNNVVTIKTEDLGKDNSYNPGF